MGVGLGDMEGGEGASERRNNEHSRSPRARSQEILKFPLYENTIPAF